VAQRVKSAVLEARIKHPHSAVSEFVTLSIGVAFIEPGENCTLDMLSQQADRALHVAKDNGRNRVGVAV
jgi:diguanylate cyclase (GGDEF)-like protein